MATSVTNNSIIISFPGTSTSFVLENVVENGVLVFAEAPPGTSQIKNYAGMTWNGTLFTIDKGNGNSLVWDADNGALGMVSTNGVGLNIYMTNANTNNGLSVFSDGVGVPGYFGQNNATADAALQAFAVNIGYVWFCNPLRQTLINCFDNTFAEVFAVDNAGRLGVRAGGAFSLHQPLLAFTGAAFLSTEQIENVAASDPTEIFAQGIDEGLLLNSEAELRFELHIKCANNANNKRIVMKANGITIYDSGTVATVGATLHLTVGFQATSDVNTIIAEIVGVSNDTAMILPNIVELQEIDVSGLGGNGSYVPFTIEATGDADGDIALKKYSKVFIPSAY